MMCDQQIHGEFFFWKRNQNEMQIKKGITGNHFGR